MQIVEQRWHHVVSLPPVMKIIHGDGLKLFKDVQEFLKVDFSFNLEKLAVYIHLNSAVINTKSKVCGCLG